MRLIQPRPAPAMLKEGINAKMSAIIDPHKGRFLDFVTEVEFIDYSLPNVRDDGSPLAFGMTPAAKRNQQEA